MSHTPPVGPEVQRAAEVISNVLNLSPEDGLVAAHNLAVQGLIEADEVDLGYIAWGGKLISAPARLQLGYSLVDPATIPRFGLRRAAWDIAFGMVNGFKPSAIAYFVLTRSFSSRVLNRTIARELKARDHDL